SGRTDEDLGTAVHEARKSLKRVRATTRLARGGLGDSTYRRDNVAVRDAGRRLGGPRDSQVLVETLDDLCARFPDRVGAAGRGRFRARLVAEQVAAERQLARDPAARAEVAAQLRAVGARIARWPLVDDDFDALEPGLRRIYRRGRRALR